MKHGSITRLLFVQALAVFGVGCGAAISVGEGGKVTAEARNYWAYQATKRQTIPAVRNNTWIRNPIDAFIHSKLEEKGLFPAPPADRVALIRRITYDLIGLPPTPEEVDAFVGDGAPNAVEKLVDRLLASPQYGEKWGRHWLDLVRYAETNGYERDGIKPYAWRFRDYVIKSFNDDKPYDQFIREQIAGDEMAHRSPPVATGAGTPYNPDPIIATGYYRLGLWDDEPVDPKQARYDELDDIVATTSQVFLAMTMNCARCHNHKIDPIPQADYYRLVAFFQDVQRFSNDRNVKSSFNLTDVSPPSVRATYEKEYQEREAKIADLVKQVTAIEDDAIKKMPAEDQRAAEANDRPAVINTKLKDFLTQEQDKEYQRLKRSLLRLKNLPEPGQQLALSVNNCRVRPDATHVLTRGNPHSPAAKVEPGFPAVLGFPDPTIPEPEKSARTSGRRTVLADWLTSKANPLTARVMVNRIWQHHFGRGIVPTPNDFGKFGTPPTHPELLDWLAMEFMDGDWRIKRLHKLIMMSNAYQMSSQAHERGLQLDPSNNFFWRFNMRRLAAEEVRDSILSVSGRLNLKARGPSIYPPIPREVLHGQSKPGEGWPTSSTEEASRRSVYVHVKRSLLVPILNQHDLADTDNSCPVRYTTTVSTQALGMLNGEFIQEQAQAFAERLQKEPAGDLPAQVRRAIRLTTGRLPTDNEVQMDVRFIQSMIADQKLTMHEALRRSCLMLLNANEFVYLD